MCGLCVADAGAVADRCPLVQASKKSPSIDSVSASRPNGKLSPTGGDKEDGEGETVTAMVKRVEDISYNTHGFQ